MQRTITIAGYDVERIGFGTMQLTGPGALGEPDQPERARATVRAAVDAGVRLIDTAGYYGPAVANRILSEALAPYPADLLIATKVGARRTRQGGFAADDTPGALRSAVEANLAQLGREQLALVQLRHMPDSKISIEESLEVLVQLRDKGLLSHIGVSNVSADLLDRALAVTSIASVQNEFRLGARNDRAVLRATMRLGIPYLAYRPLGNGALLQPDSELSRLAGRVGVGPAVLALAWLLDQGDHVVPIPGTSSPHHATAIRMALDFELTNDLRTRLDSWGQS